MFARAVTFDKVVPTSGYYRAVRFVEVKLGKVLEDPTGLNVLNVKALKPMQNKLKKLIKSLGEDYAKFVASGDADKDEDETEIDETKDEEEVDWDEEDKEDAFDEESSDESEDDVEELLQSGSFTRDYWLKKTPEEEAAKLERRRFRQEAKEKR